MDDGALIALVAANEQSAIGELYDRYGRQVYSLACRMLGDAAAAEDVTQEVFVKVWRNARRYDPERGRAATWILHMAYTTSVDLARARNRANPTRFSVAEDLPDAAVDPAEEAEIAVLGTQVRAALMRVPPEQRQAIELAYFDTMTHQEIAQRLDLPLGTVKGRLRLGLVALRQLLAAPRRKEVKPHERLSPR